MLSYQLGYKYDGRNVAHYQKLLFIPSIIFCLWSFPMKLLSHSSFGLFWNISSKWSAYTLSFLLTRIRTNSSDFNERLYGCKTNLQRERHVAIILCLYAACILPACFNSVGLGPLRCSSHLAWSCSRSFWDSRSRELFISVISWSYLMLCFRKISRWV